MNSIYIVILYVYYELNHYGEAKEMWCLCSHMVQLKTISSAISNSQPLAIFWPISAFGRPKSILVSQISCTFLMRQQSVTYKISYYTKRPTNFWSLFLALISVHKQWLRVASLCEINIHNVTYLIGPTEMIICPLTVIYLILLYNRLFNNSPAVVVLIDRLIRRVMSIVPSRFAMLELRFERSHELCK